MYIQHTHPTHETSKAEAETLYALYRACVRKLCGAQTPWALPQGTAPVPNAR